LNARVATNPILAFVRIDCTAYGLFVPCTFVLLCFRNRLKI